MRRFYEAARNAGLRPDNPAAGVRPPRVRQATEEFKYFTDDELRRLLAAFPNPDGADGRERVRRLRDLLMVAMMALQALRTIEVHRANVEDLTEKDEQLDPAGARQNPRPNRLPAPGHRQTTEGVPRAPR